MTYNNKNNYIWTDGSSSLKTGKCGWGVLGLINGKRVVFFGGMDGTNQKAELVAIGKGMSLLDDAPTLIKSDSEYSINCITLYRRKWELDNFVSSSGKPVKNIDEVKENWRLYDEKNVELRHIKGHSGDFGNELADKLAGFGRALIEGKDKIESVIRQIELLIQVDEILYEDKGVVKTLKSEQMKLMPVLYYLNVKKEVISWAISYNSCILEITRGDKTKIEYHRNAPDEAFMRWSKQMEKGYVLKKEDLKKEAP